MTEPTFPSPENAARPADRSSENDSDARREVRNYVAGVRALYVHAIVFAAVLVALFIVDAFAGRDWWVHWVLIGWGIGVLAHAAAVYLRFSTFGSDWEKRQIERRMNGPHAGGS